MEMLRKCDDATKVTGIRQRTSLNCSRSARSLDGTLSILRHAVGFPPVPPVLDEPATIAACLMTIARRSDTDKPSATSLAALDVANASATCATLLQASGSSPNEMDFTTIHHQRPAEHSLLHATDGVVCYCQNGGNGRLLYQVGVSVDRDMSPRLRKSCRQCLAQSPIRTRRFPLFCRNTCLLTWTPRELKDNFRTKAQPSILANSGTALKNRTVVLIGGCSGEGKAELRAFVDADAFVALSDVSGERGIEIAE
ncbi:hypothetical protein DOTSEDRAFT_33333 [Dothistroma septosporum NZE10]|uniref:Uncharacterized protein n=1 Tax=Dothistroma septosporum (strain NZE10 / CBS 128990) TaxID=675120 RepID=N1PWL0_DOTSN|nr:hypothetical protein DOTSEDRAFT_33333 [Dothistroma septosporum NZE10]